MEEAEKVLERLEEQMDAAGVPWTPGRELPGDG
jgi:hypothetical protein